MIHLPIHINITEPDLVKSWLLTLISGCLFFSPEYLQAIDVHIEHYDKLITFAGHTLGAIMVAFNLGVTLYKTFKKPKSDAKQDN